MKTVLKVVGLAAAAVVLLGAGLFVGTRIASAQDIADTLAAPVQALQGPGQPGGPGGHHGDMGWLDGYRDQLNATIARGLGMSVEDFDAALSAGKTPWQIAQDKGLTQDQFAQVILKAHTDVLALAVKDGKLTQAQADQILAHLQSEERRVGKECRSRWSP